MSTAELFARRCCERMLVSNGYGGGVVEPPPLCLIPRHLSEAESSVTSGMHDQWCSGQNSSNKQAGSTTERAVRSKTWSLVACLVDNVIGRRIWILSLPTAAPKSTRHHPSTAAAAFEWRRPGLLQRGMQGRNRKCTLMPPSDEWWRSIRFFMVLIAVLQIHSWTT